MPAPHPEPWRLSAHAMLSAFREGRLSPRAAVDACLARTDAVQPQLNALVARRDDAARSEADASAARWRNGTPRTWSATHASRSGCNPCCRKICRSTTASPCPANACRAATCTFFCRAITTIGCGRDAIRISGAS